MTFRVFSQLLHVIRNNWIILKVVLKPYSAQTALTSGLKDWIKYVSVKSGCTGMQRLSLAPLFLSCIFREDDAQNETGKGGTKSKFCHGCGSKYPVESAKFCCKCGIKRIMIWRKSAQKDTRPSPGPKSESWNMHCWFKIISRHKEYDPSPAFSVHMKYECGNIPNSSDGLNAVCFNALYLYIQTTNDLIIVTVFVKETTQKLPLWKGRIRKKKKSLLFWRFEGKYIENTKALAY